MTKTSQPARGSSLKGWIAVGIVVLVGVVIVFVLGEDSNHGGGKKDKAQFGCETLSKAIKQFNLNNTASQTVDGEKDPETLRELLQPPWGGPSLLENGENDLLDPWGKPYEFERRKRHDGTEFIIVRTTAPDGTPISQFGQGANAEPKLR